MKNLNLLFVICFSLSFAACSSKSDEPEPQPKDFTIFSDIVGTKWIGEFGGVTEFISDTEVIWQAQIISLPYMGPEYPVTVGDSKTVQYSYKYPTVQIYYSSTKLPETYTIKNNQLVYVDNPDDSLYLSYLEVGWDEYCFLADLSPEDEGYDIIKEYWNICETNYKKIKTRNLVR